MNISTVEGSVLWDTTLGRWVIESRRSKLRPSLCLHGSNMIFGYFDLFRTAKVKTTRYLETSEYDYPMTPGDNPDEQNSQSHRSEKHNIRTSLIARAKNFGVNITD